jgi:hypothetical protein
MKTILLLIFLYLGGLQQTQYVLICDSKSSYAYHKDYSSPTQYCAGLIYVTDTSCRIVKKAPYIHRDTLNLDKTLKEKFYHRFLKYRYDARKATLELEYITKELNKAKTLLKQYQKPKSPKRNWMQHPLL